MAGKDILRMKPEEIKRINVIHQTIDKRVTQVEAGSILSLSTLKVALYWIGHSEKTNIKKRPVHLKRAGHFKI